MCDDERPAARGLLCLAATRSLRSGSLRSDDSASRHNWILPHGEFVGDQRVNLGVFDHLVEGFAAAKTKPAIKPYGRIVLRRHFEKCSGKAGPPKAVQGLQHQL